MKLDYVPHRSHAAEIVDVCERLHKRNLLASADGNVSVRIDNEQILITPTGMSKARLKTSDLATIDLANRILDGKPSGERLMHLEVYKHCPKAKAVVHAHPPTAIAWSVAHPKLRELPSECLSEVILAAGRIPIVDYQRPGTLAMGEALRPYLPEHRIMILARHGAITWGETLEEAYNGMERLEHSAEILMKAMLLGGLSALPDSEVEELRRMRKALGEKIL